MPNTRGIKFQKDEEGPLPDIEIKKEKPEEEKEEERLKEEKEEERPKEEKEEERPKEEKKEEKPEEKKEGGEPSRKMGEKDVATRPDEPERVQPSTSRRVTPKHVDEPRGKPAVAYGKPAPYNLDIPFKVRYGKSSDEDTTEYVYHSEESVSSEYFLTEEERKMVDDLMPECKTEYYQFKAKFEQMQAEKGYFMPLKDMLKQAHDGWFPRIPDHVAEKLVPEAPEDEQEDIDERE